MQAPFLPGSFGIDDRIAGTGSLSAKVLTSYIHMDSITPAGRHAADQLLLRLRYLSFQGSLSELVSICDSKAVFLRVALHVRLLTEYIPSTKHQTSSEGDGPSQADYTFGESLLEAAEAIIVEKRKHGARPRDDIFDRPILRSRAPKRGTHQAPWENGAAVSAYPNGKTSSLLYSTICMSGHLTHFFFVVASQQP